MKTKICTKMVCGVAMSGVAMLALADDTMMTNNNTMGTPNATENNNNYNNNETVNNGTVRNHVNNMENRMDNMGNRVRSDLETPMMGTLTSQQFVNDAALGGMKEVYLSHLALQKSQNAEVKAFAGKMVTDHSAANRRLEAIARQEGLSCPSTNAFAATDPMWQNPMLQKDETLKGEDAYLLTTNLSNVDDYRAVRHLEHLSGSSFDMAYARDMVTDHINTIDEFEAASRDLTDPQLRKFATDTLPTLREHSQMAQKMENDLFNQTENESTQNASIANPSRAER